MEVHKVQKKIKTRKQLISMHHIKVLS